MYNRLDTVVRHKCWLTNFQERKELDPIRKSQTSPSSRMQEGQHGRKEKEKRYLEKIKGQLFLDTETTNFDMIHKIKIYIFPNLFK